MIGFPRRVRLGGAPSHRLGRPPHHRNTQPREVGHETRTSAYCRARCDARVRRPGREHGIGHDRQDCQSQLATLRADTVAAETSFTNAKDFTSEVAKLDEASAKLTEEKNADSVQKLTDFQSTLNLLATAAKRKVDPATAQTLSAEAQGVIDCINAIGTDATTTTA